MTSLDQSNKTVSVKKPIYIDMCFSIMFFVLLPITILELTIWGGWVSKSDLTDLIIKISNIFSAILFVFFLYQIFIAYNSANELKGKKESLSQKEEESLDYYQQALVLNILGIVSLMLLMTSAMMMDVHPL